MNCTLMHKNIPVVDVYISEDTGTIEKVGTVHNLSHLPVGTIGIAGEEKGKPSRRRLDAWWIGRSIPASREGLEFALSELGFHFASILALKSYGLSLSDQYWMRPQGMDLDWQQVNFFDNEFTKDVGELLFGHEPENPDHISLMSPDNTSDGWLKKKWVVMGGKRLLMKGGSGFYQQEPYNELVASAIMRRLDILHVPYTLIFEKGKPYSLCETFVTSTTELVLAWRVLETMKKDNRESSFDHLLGCAKELGIFDVRQALEKMLVLDYIIANTDRHYGNFGFIRNAETLEWQGLAPIYDSGTSLWHNERVVGALATSKPFRPEHSKQIKLVRDLSWFDISALKGIGEECIEIFLQSEQIDPPRREALARQIEERAKFIGQLRTV